MNLLQKAAESTNTPLNEWSVIGKAVVHTTAVVSSSCQLSGPAILYQGLFRNGTFNGGTFNGGTFNGGTFNGGTFSGGIFNGGTFNNGFFKGGIFHGGIFMGGKFLRGRFYGDFFRGGTYVGGTYRTGVFTQPALLTGCGVWLINRSGKDLIDVGCESHSYDDWDKNIDKIARQHGVSWEDREIIWNGIRFINDNSL